MSYTWNIVMLYLRLLSMDLFHFSFGYELTVHKVVIFFLFHNPVQIEIVVDFSRFNYESRRGIWFFMLSRMVEGPVIFESHSGSNYAILLSLRYAKENGAFALFPVSHGRTPISKIADVMIEIASELTMFQSKSVNTRIAQLVIIDSLVAMVAFKNYDVFYQAVQKTRKATSENKF